jgi:hypothetical protein
MLETVKTVVINQSTEVKLQVSEGTPLERLYFVSVAVKGVDIDSKTECHDHYVDALKAFKKLVGGLL